MKMRKKISRCTALKHIDTFDVWANWRNFNSVSAGCVTPQRNPSSIAMEKSTKKCRTSSLHLTLRAETDKQRIFWWCQVSNVAITISNSVTEKVLLMRQLWDNCTYIWEPSEPAAASSPSCTQRTWCCWGPLAEGDTADEKKLNGWRGNPVDRRAGISHSKWWEVTSYTM